MITNLQLTDKEYILLVNKQELYDKAVEIGYTEIALADPGDLTDEDINQLKKLNRYVWINYFVPGNVELFVKAVHQIREAGLECRGFSLSEIRNGEGNSRTIEEAAARLDPVRDLEDFLESEGYILSRNYENRCGNCRKSMRPEDKYCRYCGTLRGKGKFKPYRNEVSYVYGPPVKTKHKCGDCGYIWVACVMGGDSPKYCPKCRSRNINLLQRFAAWGFHFEFIGTEDPFDEADRLVLLTREQVKDLLSHRKKKKGRRQEVDYSSDELLEAMKAAGIEVKTDDSGPRTEAEGDRNKLVYQILCSSGKETSTSDAVTCPHCGSDMLCRYAYELRDSHSKTVAEGLYFEDGVADPVVNLGVRCLYISGEYMKYNREAPAFFCMQCGTEFETYRIPSEYLEKQQGE